MHSRRTSNRATGYLGRLQIFPSPASVVFGFGVDMGRDRTNRLQAVNRQGTISPFFS